MKRNGVKLRSLCAAAALCLALTGCSKQQMLGFYGGLLEWAGSLVLTGWPELEGEREFGVDHYTGQYYASYRDDTKTEYVFGGVGIKRKAGQEVEIDCALHVAQGRARVFWQCGDGDPQILLAEDGSYTGRLTLPAGQNYIGIECEDFSGILELTLF